MGLTMAVSMVAWNMTVDTVSVTSTTLRVARVRVVSTNGWNEGDTTWLARDRADRL